MTRRPALLLLALLLAAFAGCAALEEAPAPASSTPATPAPTDPGADDLDGARDLLRQALAQEHGRVGLSATLRRDGEEIASYHGFLDEPADAAWMRLRMDPAAFGQASDDPEGRVLDDALREGVDLLYTPDVTLLHGRSLAHATPRSGNLSAEMARTPFAAMLRAAYPSDETSAFRDARVRNATATTHEGRPALLLGIRERTSREDADGTVLLAGDPPRIVQARVLLSGRGDALDGTEVTVDLSYGDDAPEAPPALLRAAGLVHRRAAGDNGTETWTFLVDGGIPLDQVEAVLKRRAPAETRPEDLATLGALRLSHGSATLDGVLVAFVDADGDGLVSKGDTLHHNATGDRVLLLRDVETGVHVVPGPAPLALLGLVLLAARLRRRDPPWSTGSQG